MNPDHKKILEEKDLEKLDRMVAEEIFGFEVKEKQTPEHSYIQVIGENAKEPKCPLCYCRKPEYWIPDQLKRYTFYMTFAMEAAEKVGLFDEYSLRQRDDGMWCVGRYDEKTRRFVDVVSGDYPAEVIARAALIYHRMPKKKKKEKRIPKEIPHLVLRTIRQGHVRGGSWEGEATGGQRVVLQDVVTSILFTVDGVTWEIPLTPLAEEKPSLFQSLPLSYVLSKLNLKVDPQARFYRACTCCYAMVEVETLREMDIMKEIYCPSCADWVQSIPREVKSLHKSETSEWTGTLADGSPFEVIWNEPCGEFLMYVDGKLVLWREFHGDEWDRWLEKLSRTDEMLRYTNFQLAEDADLSYHCYVCRKKIPASSTEEMDESYNMCPCWEKENEEWFENFGRTDRKPRKTEPVMIRDEPEKRVERYFFILYDPKRQTLFDRRVYYEDEDVVDYGITRPDLVTIQFHRGYDFQYLVIAESIPKHDDLYRPFMCLTPFLDASEPFELTEEEEKKLEEAAIRRAIKKLKSLGVPERLEFYRLYDIEKKEFFHDRLVYASLEEAAGEIRKNRLTHPSLRVIRFQVEMTNKGELECTCFFVE